MDEAGKERERQEGILTFARSAELRRSPVEGKFDSAHLREIHRSLFQDLSHHSPGDYRPDAPAHIKGRSLEGLSYRYHVPYALRPEVDTGVDKVLSELNGPEGLRGLDRAQFSARMAKLYGDLDYMHPFAEGNSRTLRIFTMQLAGEAGHGLDWHATNADSASRDRLYIARDKEVIQRAFPGLDQSRAMSTENRQEYEAYVRVIARFRDEPTLQQVIEDVSAAKAFRERSSIEATKQFPDLAGS